MKNSVRFLFIFFLLVFSSFAAVSDPINVAVQSGELLEEGKVEPIEPPEDAIENVLSDPVATTTLDELFVKLGRQTKSGIAKATAGKIWSEWTESGSDSVNLLMYRATTAMRAKRNSLAEDLLDLIVVLAPDYVEGWNRRATLYYTMADFGRSIADIEVTLALEPRHFGALSGLAAILQQMNREEEALATWYRVLEIYPANKSAQKAVIALEEKLSGRRT